MSFVVDLSSVPSYVPSDVLGKGFEAIVDLGYRHEFADSLTQAILAAYRGDEPNMKKYLGIIRTCNDRFKEGEGKMDMNEFEKRLRADFGNEEKLTEFEKLLKSAGVTI